MKQVVIGIDNKGKYYVIAAPKKIEVVFKQPKKKPLKKKLKSWWYDVTHS